MNQIQNIEEIEEDEMTPFESQLAQAILGALEYRGFYDCGKYLDTSLIEHIRPLFHHQLQKAREEEGEKWRGNDAWSYLGNELHLYTRACIDKVKITRNGEVFEFTLPKTDIHSELDQDKV